MTTASATIFAPALMRLCSDAAPQFGCDAIRLVPAGEQERPFSHILRVAVYGASDVRPRGHLFVKVFKDKDIGGGPDAMRQRVASDFEITRRAFDALDGQSDLKAVRPIACYPDLLTIVTEEAAGETFQQFLESRLAWFPSRDVVANARAAAGHVGLWVRTFQERSAAGPPLSAAAIREYVDVRLRRIVEHQPAGDAGLFRERVLQHIDHLCRLVPVDGAASVTAHSDLSLGNILVAGNQVTVLDFAMTRFESRLHDIAKVFLQIDLLAAKPQFRRQTLAAVQKSLLAGFDPSLSVDDPLFRLTMLIHRVNHFTGLVVNRGAGLTKVYNSVVRRQHRRWVDHDITMAGAH